MSSTYFHGGYLNLLYSKYDYGRQEELFNLQLFFMRYVGQIPIQLNLYLPTSWKTAAERCARSYCIFSALSTLHLAILFIITTYRSLQNGVLEEITDALTMAIIYSFACFATCYWMWRQEALLRFLNEINEQYRHHSIAGLTFVSLRDSISLAHKLTLYWMIACVMGVVSWALAPLILRTRTLPLNCWYPFDPLQPIIYELIYISQVWCQCIMGSVFSTGSSLFVSVIVIILGQFDVLFCSLKNLDFHAQLMSGEDLKHLKKLQSELAQGEDDELNQYVFLTEHLIDLEVFASRKLQDAKSLQSALHESLVECVQLHQFILKCCDTLEEQFNPYCLVKSLQITFQLCLLAFVGVVGESSVMGYVNLVQYLALTLSELFLFTYFGELLCLHSIRCGEAFWRSQWWPNANLIKRDIFIFLINTKRVVKLTAGKFFEMDIQRLRSVIGQAFSFLTLLQKLAEKN